MFSIAATAGLWLTGCGGGASTEPTVKIKSPTKTGSETISADTGSHDGGPAAEGIGSWTGRVVFGGEPPQLPPLVQEGADIKDKAVCAVHTIPNQRLVVGADGGVANVFIFLARAPRGANIAPAPQEPILFDQKNCTFLPHAVFVRTGQTLNITNSDDVLHNTHTRPQRNGEFNQGIRLQAVVPVVYNQPEPAPFEVVCDIHAWMRAYQIALDHPFCAVSGEDGSFEIKDLPAGKHRFQVWHEGVQGGYLSRNLEVTINADQATELNIDYPAEKFTANARPATKVVNISAIVQR